MLRLAGIPGQRVGLTNAGLFHPAGKILRLERREVVAHFPAHPSAMQPSEVLQTNLRLIEGIVERVCRRAHVYGADAEDFAATVKLKLVEDDYAVLRNHQGRSSLATYLRIIIERWFADETIRDHGRWHPST